MIERTNPFRVKRPCAECPFRKELPIPLLRERAKDIVDQIMFNDEMFPCHKTLQNHGDSAWCNGALRMVKKKNRLVRFGLSFGWLKESDLQDIPETYVNPTDWVEGVERDATKNADEN